MSCYKRVERLKEEEIRPRKIFDEYLKLTEQDAKIYFDPNAQMDDIPCPSCLEKASQAFVKQGFSYKECLSCHTLFVSPRPRASAFFRYYQESASVKYWATTFYKETAEARREKLWAPKALMVFDYVQKYGDKKAKLFDIGGGYGIFAEEYKRLSGADVSVIEPSPALAKICRQKGLGVVECFLEEIDLNAIDSGAKTFVSFELFEHLHSPEFFLSCLFELMAEGDLFIFTTLSSLGLDIRTLWERSKSVSPPHHLNFLNPKSVQILLERVGFSVLEISTPGKLDIDIVCSSLGDDQNRFWEVFNKFASDSEKNRLQDFISESGFSSHMLVICKK